MFHHYTLLTEFTTDIIGTYQKLLIIPLEFSMSMGSLDWKAIQTKQ